MKTKTKKIARYTKHCRFGGKPAGICCYVGHATRSEASACGREGGIAKIEVRS